MHLLGIFVGGGSTRMGAPKGRLTAPTSGEPIVEHLVRVGREAGLAPVLVGEASPYDDLAPGVPRLADDPEGIGPLGGLRALLRRAAGGQAVSIACDMPHVTAAALGELLAHAPAAVVVAPMRDARWEPLFARWDGPGVLPALEGAIAAGVRSFQRLLAELEVKELPRTGAVERALTDWDTPADTGSR